MVTFGFIENFFFISLALVFVLVLLLVYHFKNRITVAEKKSESMYGLLTAVVKEIKTLRGMFGLGGSVAPVDVQFEARSKLTPEVPNAVMAPTEVKEVINFEFSATDNKIVVSDESESESDSESDSESEQEHESDSDSDSEEEDIISVDVIPHEHHTIHSLEEDGIEVVDIQSQSLSEYPVTQQTIDEVDFENMTMTPDDVKQEESLETDPLTSQQSEQKKETYTIENLRKMNINQLKNIAFQNGISSDISKLKKPELIALIQSSQ